MLDVWKCAIFSSRVFVFIRFQFVSVFAFCASFPPSIDICVVSVCFYLSVIAYFDGQQNKKKNHTREGTKKKNANPLEANWQRRVVLQTKTTALTTPPPPKNVPTTFLTARSV